MPTEDPNVGIAFGLVIGAGMATALGAAIVFIPALAKHATRRVLASALGISAGVMTYVSFVEIFPKALSSFEDAGYEYNQAYLYATLCFFGGVFLMVLLNYLVTAFLGGHHHHHHDHDDNKRTHQMNSNDESVEPSRASATSEPHQHDVTPCICCAEDPEGDLEEIQHMAKEIDDFEHKEHHHWEGKEQAEDEMKREVGASSEENNPDGTEGDHVETSCCEKQDEEKADSGRDEDEAENDQSQKEAEDSRKLMRMSINTALAIGLHNFPEGLATFVAALDDPRVGGVLAIAIAIHNIPEGLCVAMPIYYATGNRWKAFGWAVLSGASEPIAALLGWAVLANSFSDTLYAVLFGMVGGMMVIISSRELLPTAHRYDPEDTVVTFSFIGGMGIMALSLVLFQL